MDVLSASENDDTIAWYENLSMITPTVVESDLSDLPSKTEINVYPNPASDRLFVQIIGSRAVSYRIDIYDLLGRRVHSTETTPLRSQDHSLDVSHLVPGLYVVRIEAPSGARSRIIAVTH